MARPDLRRASFGETITTDDGYQIDVGDHYGGGREFRVFTPRGKQFNADLHVRVCFGAAEVHEVLALGLDECPAGCACCWDDED